MEEVQPDAVGAKRKGERTFSLRLPAAVILGPCMSKLHQKQGPSHSHSGRAVALYTMLPEEQRFW